MKAGATVANEESDATEDALRLVVDTTPALIHTGRPDGYLDYFNRGWLNFVGTSLEEVCGWRWTNFIHADDVARIVQKWHAALGSGEPFEAEARVRRADGEYRWMLHRKIPLRDEHGKIVKWYGSSIDIEDRKRVEEAILQKERDLQELIDAIPQHIGVIGSDGRLLFLNKSELEYSGLTFEQLVNESAGSSLAEGLATYRKRIVHPEDLERVLSARKSGILSGEPFGFEVKLRRKDGKYRRFLVRYNPHRDDNGHVLRWYSTRTDIEDLKQAEDALRRREAYLAQAQVLSHTGSFGWNLSSGELYWSDETFDILGYKRTATPTLESVFERVHPEDLALVRERLSRASQNGKGFDFEHRLLLPNGSIK